MKDWSGGVLYSDEKTLGIMFYLFVHSVYFFRLFELIDLYKDFTIHINRFYIGGH